MYETLLLGKVLMEKEERDDLYIAMGVIQVELQVEEVEHVLITFPYTGELQRHSGELQYHCPLPTPQSQQGYWRWSRTCLTGQALIP